jgi:hypothetical protein
MPFTSSAPVNAPCRSTGLSLCTTTWPAPRAWHPPRRACRALGPAGRGSPPGLRAGMPMSTRDSGRRSPRSAPLRSRPRARVGRRSCSKTALLSSKCSRRSAASLATAACSNRWTVSSGMSPAAMSAKSSGLKRAWSSGEMPGGWGGVASMDGVADTSSPGTSWGAPAAYARAPARRILKTGSPGSSKPFELAHGPRPRRAGIHRHAAAQRRSPLHGLPGDGRGLVLVEAAIDLDLGGIPSRPDRGTA